MTTTPNLAMSYLVASQAQKEVTHNDALNDLDYLVQPAVIDTTLATPPASPNLGDAYLIAASPTGAWSGFANGLAAYYSGWKIKMPETGWVVFARNSNRVLYFSGTSWALLATPKLEATTTWNPGAVTNASGITSSAITVTGAAFGDYVQVAAPYDVQGLDVTAYINAANSVKIRISNLTGGTVTLASGSWKVRVAKA